MINKQYSDEEEQIQRFPMYIAYAQILSTVSPIDRKEVNVCSLPSSSMYSEHCVKYNNHDST